MTGAVLSCEERCREWTNKKKKQHRVIPSGERFEAGRRKILARTISYRGLAGEIEGGRQRNREKGLGGIALVEDSPARSKGTGRVDLLK